MTHSRRRFLEGLALTVIASGVTCPAMSAAEPIMPHHMLCFLGQERGLNRLKEAAQAAITDFAPGWSIDEIYSRDSRDERMSRSFDVCWDRVEVNAYTSADQQAVENHGCVLYVVGPKMVRDATVGVSANALRFAGALIEAGATAVKGENAGIAHGLARWRQLHQQAEKFEESGDRNALSRICRMALAKRPLASDKYFESVGFHLVGLPEVYVSKRLGSDRDAVAVIDKVADDMKQRDVQSVLRAYKATMSSKSDYKSGDLKFNPYGIVQIG